VWSRSGGGGGGRGLRVDENSLGAISFRRRHDLLASCGVGGAWRTCRVVMTTGGHLGSGTAGYSFDTQLQQSCNRQPLLRRGLQDTPSAFFCDHCSLGDVSLVDNDRRARR
jgi:hypothetical protein